MASVPSFTLVTQAIYFAAVWSFPALMTYAALRDLYSFTIPNWIPIMVVCGFVIAALAKGNLWSLTTSLHASTGITVLVVVALLFFRGIIGGGDAKLIAAASVWMGWPQLMPFLLIIAFTGGILALVWLFARLITINASTTSLMRQYFVSSRGIPYGVAIGFAGVVIFIYQEWAGNGLHHIFGPETL